MLRRAGRQGGPSSALPPAVLGSKKQSSHNGSFVVVVVAALSLAPSLSLPSSLFSPADGIQKAAQTKLGSHQSALTLPIASVMEVSEPER